MTLQSAAVVKGYFETGDKPTQEQFGNLIDSIDLFGGVILDVKRYGATGDGTTDDTAAFTLAIADMAGKTLAVPKGTYVVTGIDLDQDSSRLHMLPGATLKLKAAAADSSKLVQISGDDVTVYGGTLDGNSANQTGTGTETIFIGTCSRFVIDSVFITGSQNYAVHIEEATAGDIADGVVRNCRITDCAEGGIKAIPNAGDILRIVADGNYVDQTAAGCINFTGTNATKGSYGCAIVNNRVKTTGDVDAIHFFGLGKHNRVIGNYVEGGSIGISISNASGGGAQSYAIVGGNNVYNPSSIGIEIVNTNHASCDGNSVDGNSATDTGISLNGVGGSFGHYACTGNNVDACTSEGIHVFFTEKVTVAGNTINLAAGRAIIVQQATDVSVMGNVCDGNGTATGGLLIEDLSARVTVMGNTFENFTGQAVQITASNTGTIDYIAVQGNTLLNTSFFQTIATTATGLFGSHILFGENPGWFVGSTLGARSVDIVNQRFDLWGTGTPQATGVSASPASIYRRYDADAAHVLYVKSSGTSNTSDWHPVQIAFAAATAGRPTMVTADAGYSMFDSAAGKPIWWDGTKWVFSTGSAA